MRWYILFSCEGKEEKILKNKLSLEDTNRVVAELGAQAESSGAMDVTTIEGNRSEYTRQLTDEAM